MTRPLLENGVRRRLLRLPNICLRQRSGVEQPIFDHDQGRILGVRVRSREGADGVEAMTAELLTAALTVFSLLAGNFAPRPVRARLSRQPCSPVSRGVISRWGRIAVIPAG
jgi:hypothetical protein